MHIMQFGTTRYISDVVVGTELGGKDMKYDSLRRLWYPAPPPFMTSAVFLELLEMELGDAAVLRESENRCR